MAAGPYAAYHGAAGAEGQVETAQSRSKGESKQMTRWVLQPTRVFALALALGSVLGLGAGFDSEASTKAPRLRVVEDLVDLGTLEMGDPAEVRFELRNDGDAPLQIYSADPG